MPRIVQRNFNGGELDPDLAARADQARYATSCRTLRNIIAKRFGPAESRSGTEYLVETKTSATASRLMPFVFNDDQAYVVEIGDLYFRLLHNGAQVQTSSVAAWAAVSYTQGDLVSYLGIIYYAKLTSNVIQIPNVSPGMWYPLTGAIFEIPTPYTAAEVSELRYVQSADVMSLFHPNHPPYELRRLGETTWQLTAMTINASITAPTGLTAVAGVSPAASPAAPAGLTATGGNVVGTKDEYKVTAFINAPAAEGNASTFAQATVGPADAGNPVALAWTAVGGASGYAIYKNINPGGFAQPFALIGVSNTNAFSDNGIIAARPVKEAPLAASNATTFSYKVTAISDADGTESPASTAATCSGQTPTSAHPNHINWTAVTGATEYNVFKADASGTYGYIGTANGTDFYDPPTDAAAIAGIEQDTSRQPPEAQTLFATTGDYPSVGAYFQQRLGAASSNNKPETFWFSRIGSYHDFSRSVPLQDDDAITATLAGERVNTIRQMVMIGGKLIFGTQDGIWTAEGDTDGVIKPTAINLRQQVFGGSSSLRMLAIDNSALYVSAHGNRINDLRYSFQDDGYSGHEVSIYSQHLFNGYELVDWAFQEHPDRLVWAVRDDGALLCMTYDREQQVWGWHRHDTGDGDLVEAVCCIPEGDETALYLVVKRTIGAGTKRYIERMTSRAFSDIAVDAIYLDCAATYDGRYSGSVTFTLSGGTTWDYLETLTITASSGYFVAGDVGKSLLLQLGTETVRIDITAYTSTTVVSGKPSKTVLAALRSTALTLVAKQVRTMTGLSHLNGRYVGACADGNAYIDGLTVAAGAVTLPQPASVVHVGLSYDQDFESLDAEDPQGQTLIGRKKHVHKVTVLVQSSKAFKAGPDEDNLDDAQLRAVDDGDDAGEVVELTTGPVDVRVPSSWANNGRVFIRNPYPLPIKILAVVAHGDIGE